MNWKHAAPDDMGGGEGPPSPDERDYLSKLADSVLKKKKLDYKPRVQGTQRAEADPATPPLGHAIPKPPSAAPPSSTTVPKLGGAPTKAGAHPAPEDLDTSRTRLGSDGTFPVGTILRFEDDHIGVFKDSRPDKEYEVVYLLLADGSVKPQGVALASYDVKKLGQLPAEFMLRLQRRMTWDRDEVIFHLDMFDYCAFIPQPRAGATTGHSGFFQKPVTSIEDSVDEEPKKLLRGRKLRITFGAGREWDAIYWGVDDLGPVVAHHTHDKWSLMHLDLNRFRDSMVVGEVVDQSTQNQIASDISGT
ncbi:MAG: hypothetical protein RLY93_08290 [Sumerlaeia bacterium]